MAWTLFVVAALMVFALSGLLMLAVKREGMAELNHSAAMHSAEAESDRKVADLERQITELKSQLEQKNTRATQPRAKTWADYQRIRESVLAKEVVA